MKNYLALPTLVASLLLTSTPAISLESDKTAPATIESDRMTYDDLKQVNVFSGNVLLVKGSLRIRGNKLTMQQTPEGYQIATSEGQLAEFRQKRDGPGDLSIEGEAERIDYDNRTDTVILSRRAQLRKRNGSQVTDEVAGHQITYNQRTEFFTVNGPTSNSGGNGGDSPQTGRVKAVIQPRTDTPTPSKGGQTSQSPSQADSVTNSMKTDRKLKSAPIKSP